MWPNYSWSQWKNGLSPHFIVPLYLQKGPCDSVIYFECSVWKIIMLLWTQLNAFITYALLITRSHCSMTSVVRATRLGNGRRQTYPSHHTHTLDRQSPNTAYVITSAISPQKPHFGKRAPGVTSPQIAKVTTQLFLFLYLYVKSFYRPRAQPVEPILTRDTPTDAYSNRVVPFGG